MRGTLRQCLAIAGYAGIIPAYAGNTYCLCLLHLRVEDHPRVCGEHMICYYGGSALRGSSPRMRGTRIHKFRQLFELGIIPAYAGNTPAFVSRIRVSRDHPRVCGEHIPSHLRCKHSSGSSPRMRGTPVRVTERNQVAGIIPAYAGNTLRDYSNFVVSKFMSFVFHLV